MQTFIYLVIVGILVAILYPIWGAVGLVVPGIMLIPVALPSLRAFIDIVKSL